jgi:hypothetical protein
MKADNSPEKISIEVDDYFWQVRHGWLVDSGVGLKGISVSVWRQPGGTRELVIDFPFSVFGLNRSPKRADLIATLIPAIKASRSRRHGRSNEFSRHATMPWKKPRTCMIGIPDTASVLLICKVIP